MLCSPFWISSLEALWESWFSVLRNALCLFPIRCACSWYTVPVANTLCLFPLWLTGFSLCLLLLQTEFWHWSRFITFPLLLQSRQTFLIVLLRTCHLPKNRNNCFKNLRSPKTGNALRPQVAFLSTRQTNQKTIGPFAPTGTPQLLSSKVEGNHFRPQNFKRYVEMSNSFSLCSCSVRCSTYKMFRLNISFVDPGVNNLQSIEAIKSIPLFKRKFL